MKLDFGRYFGSILHSYFFSLWTIYGITSVKGRPIKSKNHDCSSTDGKCIEFFEKILFFSRYLKHLPDHT